MGPTNRCWSPPPAGRKFMNRLWISGSDAFCTWILKKEVIVSERGSVGISHGVAKVAHATAREAKIDIRCIFAVQSSLNPRLLSFY